MLHTPKHTHTHTLLHNNGLKPLHPPRGSSIAEAINNHRRLLGVVADSLIYVTTSISVLTLQYMCIKLQMNR